ncbi:MAG: MCE family protein [Alphaproteobacteria bacterium]|nr:MCE family protein [Alphaproteobacteria bacterium]
MQKKKTYKMTGLFVIVGLLCLLGIIAYSLSSKFAVNKKDLVVMYFDESINGLSVGASVVLNGVDVGKVVKIKLIPNLEDGTFQTPVYIAFNAYKDKNAKKEGNILKHLIDKGLRARLTTANYLTGQLMIELVMDPSQPPIMRGDGTYMEIPTEFSSFAMFSKDLEDVPLREILSRLGNILGNIDENLPSIMKNVNSVSASVDKNLPSILNNVNDVSENINNITSKIERVMDKKNGETTKTINNINITLEEISKASRSLKNLTDYLERHPEAIIQGKEK